MLAGLGSRTRAMLMHRMHRRALVSQRMFSSRDDFEKKGLEEQAKEMSMSSADFPSQFSKTMEGEVRDGKLTGSEKRARQAAMESKAKEMDLPPRVDLPPLGEDFTHGDLLDRLERLVPLWSYVWDNLALAAVDAKQGANDLLDDKPKKVYQSSLPVIREKKIDKLGRAYGTGKRKSSVACVWIKPGEGAFTINKQDFTDYFQMIEYRQHAIEALVATRMIGKFDIECRVFGGGLSGQSGAIRHGIARALQNYDPLLRSVLKPGGFLTRDTRVKEEKKPGKVKARKSYQWVKR